MKTILRTSRFKKDIKLMQKRGKDIEKLKQIIKTLVNGIP
jgi:mRNA-degrading endonuclease YafQ of YafQ-DinJ toxin-antitoxin module